MCGNRSGSQGDKDQGKGTKTAFYIDERDLEQYEDSRPSEQKQLVPKKVFIPTLAIVMLMTGWSAVVCSWLTATSATQVQEILLPQPPEQPLQFLDEGSEAPGSMADKKQKWDWNPVMQPPSPSSSPLAIWPTASTSRGNTRRQSCPVLPVTWKQSYHGSWKTVAHSAARQCSPAGPSPKHTGKTQRHTGHLRDCAPTYRLAIAHPQPRTEVRLLSAGPQWIGIAVEISSWLLAVEDRSSRSKGEG
ncbi:hypothetical protein AAY473_026641 [Plecturocebus cupreus]